MPNGADAVFTEVLEVQIDVDAFATGLASLESAYEAFVDRINEKGFGAGSVLQVGAFTALEQQIGQLTQNMTQFDGEVTTAFTEVDGQLKKLQASIQTTGQAAVDAKAKLAGEQVSSVADTSGGSLGGVPNPFSQLVGGPGTFMAGVSQAISSMNGGLLGMLGYMAALRVAWTAVGAAIEVVVNIIKAPFEVIKAGFDYLTKIQDESANMQGTIAANAALSADLGKNFQLAGVAAHEIAVEMQQLSIAMNVPAAQLEHTFNDVLESGGLHFTKTLQGIVDLTKEFTLAVSKSSTETEGQRKAMNEIPKLLDGQVVANSRILNTLGLTNTQWQQIRTEALAHGDLVEKLAGLMAPYLTVVEQADLRQSRIVENIKLQGQVIAGAIALPLWESFTNILERVSGFLQQHSESLKLAGTAAVDLTKEFITFVAELAAGLTGTTSLHSVFQSVLETVNNLVGALRIAVQVTSTWGHELGTIVQFGADPFNFFSPAAIKDFNTRISAFESNYVAKVKEIYQQGNAVARGFDVNTFFDENGQFKGAPNLANSQLNQIVDPRKALQDPDAEKKAAKAREDAFHATQEAFRTELAQSKQVFAETEADIKARQETGLISFHEASLEKIQALQTERDTVRELIKYYTDLALTSGVKPREIANAVSSMGRVDDASKSATKVAITSTVAADTANDEKITQAHFQRLDQMELAHQRAMLVMYKQQASEGIISKTELFDREVSLTKQEHDVVVNNLQQEIDNIGADTAKKSQLQDQLALEDQKYTDSVTANTGLRVAIAQKEADDLARMQERNNELQLRSIELKDQIASHNQALSAKMISDSKALAAIQVADANNEVVRAQRNLDEAQSIEQKAIATERLLKAQIDLSTAQLNQIKVGEQTPGGTPSGAAASPAEDMKALVSQPFESFKTTTAELAVTMGFFAQSAAGLVGAIKSGFASGGVAGAIGGGLSSAGSIIGGLSKAFSSAPIVGAAIQGVGELFTVFSSLFTSAAKHIASDIKKSVDELMQSYSNGQTTMVATISGLEAERQDAINRLSGKKGGQDQLNQLLPQLDNQIAQLKQQQKQVLDTFNQSVAVLQLQSSTLGGVLTTWTQINKQVKDYLDAGGDAAKAAQFLSLSLQQQLQTAQTSLNDGENQAIQDAQQLNGLLTQRVNLAKQFAQQEFALKNQDALERSANPAINAALTYQAQKAANDAQLTALDQQIQLYTLRVSMEKQVFDLASSTADLQAQANKLNLSALQQTIQGWQDLQKIIASITKNGAGLFQLNPNLFNAPAGTTNNTTNAPTQINITVQGAGSDGAAIGQAIAKELNLLGRFGADVSYA